jgi:hypothetical protein
MIRDVIFALIVLWLTVISVTQVAFLKGQREYLKFADMVLDDNLKNVIVSGGKTFLIVDMAVMEGYRDDVPARLWSPVYISEEELPRIADWRRSTQLMVNKFEEDEFDRKLIMAKVDQYFKQRLVQVQDRKDKEKK